MSCIFCDLNNKKILRETDNFVVMVGKGIITVGHVMIIPKRHYLALGEIQDQNLINEFTALKFEVSKKLEASLSKPFFFEYGVFMQSVNHAHLHVVPSETDLYKTVNIDKDFFLKSIKLKNLEFFKIKDFSELIEFYSKNKQYIYFENNNSKYLIKTNDLIKEEVGRYLSVRRFFEEKIGIKGIRDWKAMTEEDKKNDEIKIEKTIKLFKK